MNLSRTSFGKLFCLLILTLLFNSLAKAQDAESSKYFGTLEKELIPDKRELYGTLFEPAGKLSVHKFTGTPERGALSTVGLIIDPRNPRIRLKTLLIEPPQKPPYLCADLNADSVIDKNECQAFTAAKDDGVFEQILKLPFKSNLFPNIPVYLRFKQNDKQKNLKTGQRVIEQSAMVISAGLVRIKDRMVRAGYEFNISNQTIDPNNGLVCLDVNGDGEFHNAPFSAESSYTSDNEVVFRLGALYVSTENVDLDNKKIAMRARRTEEYLRQELEVGKEMTDFSFVDFDNKKRSLSEFRGKYLLIDFWGLWCGDCVREIPYQMAAYKRFRSKGFEILGMDSDDNPEEVKTVLEKNGITWTQARYDSIKDLIEKTYVIQQYPSTILLGPDGKVLVLEQKDLREDQLLRTLEKIFSTQ